MTQQQLIDDGYVDGKKSFEYLFRQIAENFDFEKVYTVMKALDWGWSVRGSNETYIPSIEAIKLAVLEKCKRAYEEEITIGSGGLWVEYDKKDQQLIVSFIATDWVAE